ncbi:MAG TPA: DUF499 domain-containing protein [Anaeromyxobacteraceae bacterium]|jgi:hypothetical protein|nr:DUF499 domain-containing protein [Anaeromyxobacteraceae bacterium]
MALKPWREVVLPHQDVLDGKFQEAEFAADLTKVVQRIASADYQDPIRFFERTVITEGMSLLLQSVLKRLTGRGGDPVIQLQTAFGGGKTHTMLAVYHVAGGAVSAEKMQGVPALLERAKVKELPKARVAVLDGNALSPSQPREHGKVKANTLWGELAYQIGDEPGYALVAAADKDGTSPGKDALGKLLKQFGPVVVLMDETVAYLRQFESGKSYKGGTFNSNLSFLQALTEAAAGVPNAIVLASLPESAMEVGDDHGHKALDAVQKLFGRIEAVWKPVATDEAFEIVRRRLFKAVQDEKARDEVCVAFADLYRKNGEKFPADTRDGSYLRKLKASYPIHPEVFERLYEDWSTLPKFQRTRGVLRLMARLIHSLWRADNKDFVVLPGSIPLDDHNVRNELIKYLPAGWDPILDKDVDGAHSEPRRIDDETPVLGALQACRRSARAIFLGSAPSVAEQKVRGVGVERVRLGCAQPGQAIGHYDDALRRLSEQLHNLYSGNDRYWFDLRPNLRREMEDRMQRYDVKLHLYPAIQERLQKVVKGSVFQAVHVFQDAKDIPDKVDLRLVVLDPEHGHKRKDFDSRAVAKASAILAKHGEKPREFQNRILFLVADASAVQALRDHVRRFLAWDSIVDDADELNLDKHHEKEAKKNLEDAAARVDGSIKEVYRLLLVPTQDPDAEGGLTGVTWEDEALALSGSTFDKALENATREKEWVIKTWAPTHLRTLLRRWFWKADVKSVGLGKVWLDSCRYLYMPRLATEEVYLQTVREGIRSVEWFGYAASEKEPGEFEGLLYGEGGSVYLDNAAVLIDPATAKAAKDRVKPPGTGGSGVGEDEGEYGDTGTKTGTGTGGGKTGTTTVKPTTTTRRFHGTTKVDPADPISSFTEIVQNVIEHFQSQYGTEVVITVDVEAKKLSGFDTKTVRDVKENAKALSFSTAEFEEH